MGSLMAGWDSHNFDNPRSASLERNRSITQEEIDAFWKSKKEIEDEHLKALSNKNEDCEKFHKSSTVPLTRIKESLGVGVDTSLEHLIKKNCWWTKSNWAFLNEPPVMEAASNKYASQFHVANLGSSKINHGDEISA